MERPHAAELRVEVDGETGCRYIVWQPMVTVGLGTTEREALEDLRRAAHAGIDCSIDEKCREVEPGNGSGTG
jgi:hypothetical protein